MTAVYALIVAVVVNMFVVAYYETRMLRKIKAMQKEVRALREEFHGARTVLLALDERQENIEAMCADVRLQHAKYLLGKVAQVKQAMEGKR